MAVADLSRELKELSCTHEKAVVRRKCIFYHYDTTYTTYTTANAVI